VKISIKKVCLLLKLGTRQSFTKSNSAKPVDEQKTESLRFLRALCGSAVKSAFLFALCFTAGFAWQAQTDRKITISQDRTKLDLGNRVLLDNEKDGFMSIHQVLYSPDGDHFAVIGCGYECTDNIGFLFNADGRGKRKFTGRWDSIFQDKIEWSADGKKLYYYRINSTGADPPASAPSEGWVEVSLGSGRKKMASSRTLKPGAKYAVFNVLASDTLNVREAPGVRAKITARLPSDATGIEYSGESRKVGKDTWAKIKFNGITGWVNQSYLYEAKTKN